MTTQLAVAPPSFYSPAVFTHSCRCGCCHRPLYKSGNETFGMWAAGILCVAGLAVAWVCLRENKR